MDLLSQLAMKHQTDKGPQHHNYTPRYFEILKGLKNSPLILLEIGVGGYHFPDRGGGSLRMWEEFFPKAHIHGIDIYDKSPLNKGRVHTHIVSQTHEQQLINLINVIGSPDVIIDDGSHISSDIIFAFEILFPRLKKGGIYIVEDTETSYWKDHFFGSTDIDNLHVETSMNYFKRLTDSLNSDKFDYSGPKFDIESINFYKGFLVINKTK